MKFEYKKIVIAVDGSKASEHAFNKAVEIAKRNDSKLFLVHVIDARNFATAEVYDKSLSERAEKYAHDLIDEYIETANEAGVDDIVKIVRFGSPKVAISKEIAPELEADLIIVGATGLNAVERFLIGSVSESIVRYAKVDVLVVR